MTHSDPLTLTRDEPAVRRRTLSVLMVCTADISRSAMAAAMLRARVGDLDVVVRSAGTRALVDQPMPRPARRAARRMGASPAEVRAHRARWLGASMVDEADLVLVMTRSHRSTVADLVPWQQNVFTANEFARLVPRLCDAEMVGETPRERLAAVLAAAPDRYDQDGDDIIDPNSASRGAFREAAEQLVPAVDAAARLLRSVSRGY